MKNLESEPRKALLPERAAIVAVLFLAFALRIYRLGAQAIWWDESLSVYRATHDLGTILSNTIVIQKVVTVDTLPPLYFVLLHFAVAAFGTTEFALRLLSLVANVATVALLYVLARRWFPGAAGRRTALLAALLGALAPFYVWYAQEARPYALVLFWSTLAVYALVRGFPERSTHWMAVYVLAAIAALYTHYFALFLFPFHALVIAARMWKRQRGWILLPALPLASAVFLAPIVMASAAGNAGTGPYWVPLDMILRDILNSFSVGITIDPAQALWIDLALGVLFAAGILLAADGRWLAIDQSRILLLSYLLVPVLGVFAASYVRPLYQNSRYLIAISPAFYLGVAAGTVALARRWRLFAVPALGVFLIGAMLSLNNLYFNPLYGKDDNRAWAESLSERVRSGDFLILNSPHAEELFQYYTRTPVPWISLPVLRADRMPSPEQDQAAIAQAYREHPRIWYLAMDVPFDDPESRIEKYLKEQGMLLDQVLIPGTSTELALSLYAPALPIVNAAAIPHPLDVAFSGHLRLRGYGAPAAIAPGGRDLVRLYWEIDEPVGEDYAVSVRLVDAAGTRAGQWDAAPLGNRSGSSTWRPNTILEETRDLPVPAGTREGTYHLEVVPYHAATGSALGDVVTLGEIQISRAPSGRAIGVPDRGLP